MRHCRVCEGPLAFLGTLGTRDHYRCQSCGLDSSRPAEETDLEEAGVCVLEGEDDGN